MCLISHGPVTWCKRTPRIMSWSQFSSVKLNLTSEMQAYSITLEIAKMHYIFCERAILATSLLFFLVVSCLPDAIFFLPVWPQLGDNRTFACFLSLSLIFCNQKKIHFCNVMQSTVLYLYCAPVQYPVSRLLFLSFSKKSSMRDGEFFVLWTIKHKSTLYLL